jgi:small-conductance mechanosensitive channel
MTILDRAGETLGGFLPRLGGALVLLLLGLLLARLLGGIVRRLLEKIGTDTAMTRWGVTPVLERAGLGSSLAALLGRAVRFGVAVVVVFAALSLLGLDALEQTLNQAALFLPKLLVAAGLLLAGVVLGALARDRVDRLAHQMDFPVSLGRVAQVAIVTVFVVTAAAQIAIATGILMVVLGIVLAGAVATFALAFGLGGRDVARELSAGRSLRTLYEPGTSVAFGEVRGEVVDVGAAVTVLRTPQGGRVHVPNAVLLGAVVEVGETTTPK